MLIEVVYNDGRFGMVKPYLLDKLLEEKMMAAFMRSDGWVVVDRDIIRSQNSSQGYDGAERRDLYALNALLRRKLLQEIALIVGTLALISTLLSGLL